MIRVWRDARRLRAPVSLSVLPGDPPTDTLRAMYHEKLLMERIAPFRRALLDHPVYKTVRDTPSLQLFMQSHVFAVWDFMSLLKALQRRVTCVTIPWIPARDTEAARLVNEIVLAEESDEIGAGRFTSHFELYLAAMEGVGADRGPIQRFAEALRRGREPHVALVDPAIPNSTREFVAWTLETAKTGADHEIAARSKIASLAGVLNVHLAMEDGVMYPRLLERR